MSVGIFQAYAFPTPDPPLRADIVERTRQIRYPRTTFHDSWQPSSTAGRGRLNHSTRPLVSSYKNPPRSTTASSSMPTATSPSPTLTSQIPFRVRIHVHLVIILIGYTVADHIKTTSSRLGMTVPPPTVNFCEKRVLSGRFIQTGAQKPSMVPK
jgi:hypothetical protein